MTTTKLKQEPQRLPPSDEENQLMARAIAAFYRASAADGSIPQQPSGNDSTVQLHRGKVYVVLRNVNGTLAVYRYRRQGILKRLRRWPQKFDE